MTDFKKEHIEQGDIYIFNYERKCLICGTLTKFKEPIHKAFICKLECLHDFYKLVELAEEYKL